MIVDASEVMTSWWADRDMYAIITAIVLLPLFYYYYYCIKLFSVSAVPQVFITAVDDAILEHL